MQAPSNHDDPKNFRRCLREHAYLPAAGPLHFAAGDHGPVRIIGLDVTISGDHHGEIDEAAADWLEAALAPEPARPTILMMHQPPFETGIPYLDTYLCRRGQALAAIVAHYPAIERVMCSRVRRVMQAAPSLHRTRHGHRHGAAPVARGRSGVVHRAAPRYRCIAGRQRPGW